MTTPHRTGPAHTPDGIDGRSHPPSPGERDGAVERPLTEGDGTYGTHDADARGTTGARTGAPTGVHGTDGPHNPHGTDGTDGTHGTHGTHGAAGPAAPSGATGPHDASDTLLSSGEREEFARRMHQAVKEFVDRPRRSVEEADTLFEDIVRRINTVVAERHHGLRESWHDRDGRNGREAAAETEELRNALLRYRDAAERLLRL